MGLFLHLQIFAELLVVLNNVSLKRVWQLMLAVV